MGVVFECIPDLGSVVMNKARIDGSCSADGVFLAAVESGLSCSQAARRVQRPDRTVTRTSGSLPRVVYYLEPSLKLWVRRAPVDGLVAWTLQDERPCG